MQARSDRMRQVSTVSESTTVAEAQVVEAEHTTKTKSVVWRFFKITDARNAKGVRYAKCGLCKSPKPDFLIVVGNTSNMLQHLQRHHKTEYLVDAVTGQKVSLLTQQYDFIVVLF